MNILTSKLRSHFELGRTNLAVILPAILLIVLAGSNALHAQTSLTGAGATFPYPMYSKWFDEYHKLHPDIQIMRRW
jgi:phosphate transport system substrate-binding protein